MVDKVEKLIQLFARDLQKNSCRERIRVYFRLKMALIVYSEEWITQTIWYKFVYYHGMMLEQLCLSFFGKAVLEQRRHSAYTHSLNQFHLLLQLNISRTHNPVVYSNISLQLLKCSFLFAGD